MISEFCLQFNSMRAGSGSGCRKLSELFLVLCAIILFLGAPVQVVEAASTVTFIPEWQQTSYYYTVDRIIPARNHDSAGDWNDFYIFWSGYSYAYSSNKLEGGYTYNGYVAVDYDVLCNTTFGTSSHFTGKTDNLTVLTPTLIFDNSTLPNSWNERRGDSSGRTWFLFKDLYVSGTDRVLFRFDFKGYTYVRNINMAVDHNFGIPDFKVNIQTDVIKYKPESYSLIGTTEGFNDNLTDFDNSMQQGSNAENNLTDTALGHINSYEFSDLSSGSGMASALSFYSSVVMAGYTSLGDFKQLFGIVFALIIIVVILRIRRDSS